MIDYRKIWESINIESKSNPLQPQIARRIPSKGLFPVFLATDFRKGIRLLYIKIENIHSFDIDKLPRFRGLEISLVVESLAEFNNQEFIKFTQSIPNIDNVFELVISDICEKIISVLNKNKLQTILTKILTEWKVFFENQENEILSLEAQKGLLGELYLLKNYLFHKYSITEALNYWTGSEHTNHDFQILNKAIEVKATSSKQHKKFIISSEKQLDNTGLESLYLALFSLNLHSNMPDRTLPALIREIYTEIEDDPIATFHFQIKLTKYGYNEKYVEKYKLGFSLDTVKFFEVTEGFPRLLQHNLPNGIGDLKYSVVVSACSPYEITTDVLNYI